MEEKVEPVIKKDTQKGIIGKYAICRIDMKYPIRNEISILGEVLGVSFKTYEINGKKWLSRQDLEKKYPAIRNQFMRLTKEWIPELNRYFLDKNFNDYKIINRTHFQRLFSLSQNVTMKASPQPIVLLSPKGMLKLLSRSSNKAMKIILLFLTEMFERLQLYDINDFIGKYFKLMTPAERCFYATMYDIFPEITPQHNISRMHVDFVVRNVVFEIDGKYHLNKDQWLIDAKRSIIASKQGFITVRIPNNIVLEQPQWVRIQVIEYMKHIIIKVDNKSEKEG